MTASAHTELRNTKQVTIRGGEAQLQAMREDSSSRARTGELRVRTWPPREVSVHSLGRSDPEQLLDKSRKLSMQRLQPGGAQTGTLWGKGVESEGPARLGTRWEKGQVRQGQCTSIPSVQK